MEPDFAKVTQYLPNLPKARLDDRTFEDLVEECLLRIPRYCPEWTNHNAGDPGVTLIELFAWLVHQMLYRFNQVPLRHYIAFLELLGIRLQPPASATTELTFYLTKAQDSIKTIPAGTEVATVRTETQEAEIFTTDQALVVGQARLKHFLFGRVDSPNQPDLKDFPNAFGDIDAQELVVSRNTDTQASDDSNAPIVNLFEPCQPGQAFYLVLEPTQIIEDNTLNGIFNSSAQEHSNSSSTLENRIAGNVIAITFRGPAAVTTGINPSNPPLRWQAWNGIQWCDGILREQTTDDKTRGFSFDRLGDGGPNPEAEGADVILHLPSQWPSYQVNDDYQGHWIRCLYIEPDEDNQQFGYERSPQINKISLRTIGVVGSASECIKVGRELLGVSNGKAGQTFELSRRPILERKANEYIEIEMSNREPERWQEVSDFGDSDVNSLHYLIDNSSGSVQFGPLVREPEQLQQQTRDRSQLQSWGRPQSTQKTGLTTHNSAIPAVLEATDCFAEQQYGKVPPLGAEIYITGYRVGGGSQGNVQAQKITVLKSSIPYVKQVTNYVAAKGGQEKESLNDAIIRVPAVLRTRKTALTAEDFERTAKAFVDNDGRTVHRAHCITTPHLTTPGVVRLLIVPTLLPKDTVGLSDRGLHPDTFKLNPDFQRKLDEHINLHKALGIRVTTEAPECLGIQVLAEVYPQTQYQSLEEKTRIKKQLCAQLYRFLNPITGGAKTQINTIDNASPQGWPLGRTIQVSDVVALLQGIPDVRSVGQVQLFQWQPYKYRVGQHWETGWMRSPEPLTKIELSETAAITSWSEPASHPIDANPAHSIILLEL